MGCHHVMLLVFILLMQQIATLQCLYSEVRVEIVSALTPPLIAHYHSSRHQKEYYNQKFAVWVRIGTRVV